MFCKTLVSKKFVVDPPLVLEVNEEIDNKRESKILERNIVLICDRVNKCEIKESKRHIRTSTDYFNQVKIRDYKRDCLQS